MRFSKVRRVASPRYGTDGSAGIDFFVPEDFTPIELGSFEGVVIPSGVRVEIPEGYAMVAFNKSGIATTLQLQVGANVIDSDYQGEIHLHVINCSRRAVYIQPRMKLIQFVVLPILHPVLCEIDNAGMHLMPTVRGEGGFGSTGGGA
jgi:dUTPase